MFKSKVIDVVRTFTPEELKKFRDFLRSPYHNTNRNVIRLFEIMRKHSPGFTEDKLDKKKIYAVLFKGKQYNDIVMRILISDLLQLAQDFLVERYLENDPLEQKKLLLTEMLFRGVDRLFFRTYNEAISLLRDSGIDDNYFKHRYDIEELRKGFFVARDMQHMNSSNLIDMGESMFNYFLMKISSVVHEISVNKENFNTGFGNSVFVNLPELLNVDKISSVIKHDGFQSAEITELYLCALMINYDCVNDDYYFRLKELFYKNINKFTHGTKYNIYMSLLNYCGNKHWNDRDNYYRREQFSLFKDMLDGGLYSWAENECMTIIIFRSILSICTMLKEFDYMEEFIKNYVDKLAPDQRENMYNFSSAKLNFVKKRFVQALEFITKVNYELFTFKYDVKTLMMQIYFELGYIEEAFSLMETYKRFLANNKNVSQSFRVWNMNFIRFYGKLLNLKAGKNSIDLHSLEKEISTTTNSASQNWLLEKAGELNRIGR